MASIFVRARITPKAGREADFDALVQEFCTTVAAGEPDTLGFGWFRSPDNEYIVIEHYKDVAAVVHHGNNVGHLFASIGPLVETSAPLEVHGEVTQEVKDLWAAFNPVYLPTIASI